MWHSTRRSIDSLTLAATLVAATCLGAAPATDSIDAIERDVARRIGEIRHEHGLGALIVDPALARVAREYSCELARRQALSHTGSAGESIGDRVETARKRFRLIAENLAVNRNAPDPAAAAVNGWMRSAGHRANILDERFTATGIGVCRDGSTYYFTEIFVRPA